MRKISFRRLLILTLVVGNLFVWYAVYREDRRGVLTVAFLDIGQGDAIFIDAPNGNQVLLDGGPPGRAVLAALGEVLPFYDRTIDLLIASHPDADHIGGFLEVTKRFRVSGFLAPGAQSETQVYRRLKEEVAARGIKEVLARRGMRLPFGSNAELQILFPDGDTTGWETNRASIVAKLVYGEDSFLLTGDSPKAIENYLIDLDPAGLDVDVLKAGHHGSDTSSGEPFLEAVSPEYAILSVGAKNRYGHPHPAVLKRLEEASIKILRTDQSGTIIFQTNGRGLTLID